MGVVADRRSAIRSGFRYVRGVLDPDEARSVLTGPTVALDAHHVGSGQGGNETYIRELLRAWGTERLALLPVTSAERLETLRSSAHWTKEVAIIRKGAVSRWGAQLGLAARHRGAKVLHTTYFAPVIRPEKFVVTVHDTSFKRFPQWFPAGYAKAFEIAVGHAVSVADAVIAISHTMADELSDAYPKARHKIVAIPCGVAIPPAMAPTKPSEHEQFLLYVGNLSPRKNLETLIESFACAKPFLGNSARLKIVGGGDDRALRKLCAAKQIEGFVDFVGRVNSTELENLYRGASAVAFISLYEGFGLPLLEALSFGKRVIVSDIPVHKEVAGSFGTYVDPTNLDAISSEIVASLSSEYSDNPGAIQYAERYNWHRTADGLENVYNEVVSL